jgi:Zn-dependent M28 family amino/carboxypeptidase
VVGELTGTTTPEKIYIIGGHYDHLDGDMPGGDDNASGTAGVLEAARVLSQYKFESTIRFICFNAEEDKQVGSKDYVNNHVIPGSENIVGMINMDMILRPGSDVNPKTVIDAELEAQSKHPPSVAWARAYQQAAADFVPSLSVNDTIVDCEFTSDNDAFLNKGYPAFLVIENSLPDFWDANKYFHKFDDASDRLANDSGSPSGVTYDFVFATNVTRTAVALIAQEAILVHQP